MKYRNSIQTYGWLSISLHWLAALLVIGLFILGLYMRSLDYYDPAYHSLPSIHQSFGIILFILMSLRIVWRSLNPKPQLDISIPQWQQRISTFLHYVLYGLVFMVMLSGYFISTADGSSIEFFSWLEIPALIYSIEYQEDSAGMIHEILAWTTIILVSIHALAALKHHFIDKDDTLRKMLGRLSFTII